MKRAYPAPSELPTQVGPKGLSWQWASTASTPAQQILSHGVRQLQDIGRHDLADAVVAQTMSQHDGSADAHSVIASILDRRGDWQGSLAHLRQAHALMPHGPQTRLNLALALIRLGHHREGFSLYEARLDKPTWSGFSTVESRASARQLLLQPGDPVAGRRILVLAEQGLGDCIMFARYIPMLAKRGARIALACNPSLQPFFARVPGIEVLLSPPPDQPLAQIDLRQIAFDAWAPLLSLLNWIGPDSADCHAASPYWKPAEDRVAQWRRDLAAAGRKGAPKVGVVFRANPQSVNQAERSLPIGEVLPLLAVEGIDFVNLQHGAAGRELAAAAPAIIDPLPGEVPLDEYAALMASTDLLVSVDTMAVHCAGAIGHPAWVAVPFSPHWAWGLEQTTTPWYPSVRIFRQAEPDDWSGTVRELAESLRALAAGSRATPSGTLRAVNGPVIGKNETTVSPARNSPDPAAQCLVHMARALLVQGLPDVARIIAELARNTDGAWTETHDVMGDVLAHCGDWDAVLQHRRTAAAAGAPQHRLKLSLMQLVRGEFEQGFANYEARRDIPLWIDQALPLPASIAPARGQRLLPGDPVRGRRIVVFTEQGLGDTMFGARFLTVLASRGAEVTLVCREPMRPLFARMQCCKTILSPPADAPHAKIDLGRLAFDAFCPLLSLPHVLGLTRSNLAPRPPYLTADPELMAVWRARYEAEGRADRRKVGLIWQANPSNQDLVHRSMRAADLLPLLQLDNVDFINLQHGPASRELPDIAPRVIDAMRQDIALDEFAAALAATDLVISVDTMAAHAAGALGRPVWVALPAAPGWYWGLGDRTTEWYPTAQLFRQTAQSDWSGVVAKLVESLQDGEAAKPRSAVMAADAEHSLHSG